MPLSDYQMFCAYASLEPLPLTKQDVQQAAIVGEIRSLFSKGVTIESVLPPWTMIGASKDPRKLSAEEQKHHAIMRIIELTGGAISYERIKQSFDARDARIKAQEQKENDKCQKAEEQA